MVRISVWQHATMPAWRMVLQHSADLLFCHSLQCINVEESLEEGLPLLGGWRVQGLPLPELGIELDQCLRRIKTISVCDHPYGGLEAHSWLDEENDGILVHCCPGDGTCPTHGETLPF